MELQHITVKFFLAGSAPPPMAEVIPVFHGWIQDQVCDELLIDVADYRHVFAGPGVVLVGHEADYGLDTTGNRAGVLYRRKQPLGGTDRDRLRQAFRAALGACRRLEEEPRLRGLLRVDRREAQIIINDRLLAPSSEQTFAAVREALKGLLDGLSEGEDYRLEFQPDPRRRFELTLRAESPLTLEKFSEA